MKMNSHCYWDCEHSSQLRSCDIHCVSKTDTDVAHYNFNAHQLILVIFGRGVG